MNEMPNYKPFQTGVPHDIWIDKGKSYIKGGHGPRVKVFSRNNPNRSVSFSTVDLEPKNPIPKGEENTMSIAQQWIGYNPPNIEKLMNGEMSEDDFLKNMVVFKNGRPFKKEELNDILTYRIFKKQGIIVVARKSDGLLNAERKGQEANGYIFDTWFDSLENHAVINGSLVLFLRKDGDLFVCDNGNGRIDAVNV